ncbi:MAG: helix-turn-helix transcriptional regulator [Candidatus Krumholzibacteriia bacterium]
MTDEPILKTPGELLGEAREASGRSLAEIAERTKIPVRQLESIERDEYHRLSGPLYVKSFLRAYAEAVGLDPETLVDLYGRSTGEGAAAGPTAKADVWETETVTITRVGVDWGRLLAWGGGGAALVVAVWFLLRMFAAGGGGADPGRTVRPPAAELPATTAPADTTAAGADTTAAAADTTAAADRADGNAPAGRELPPGGTDGAAAVAARAVAANDLPAAPSGRGPIAFAGGGRWPVRVRLLAAGPLEAAARCDGESRFQAARFPAHPAAAPPLPDRGVEPGRVYAVREGLVAYWRAQDHCGLRLDHTDGVEVSVNGEARDISRLRPGQEIILDAHR